MQIAHDSGFGRIETENTVLLGQRNLLRSRFHQWQHRFQQNDYCKVTKKDYQWKGALLLCALGTLSVLIGFPSKSNMKR